MTVLLRIRSLLRMLVDLFQILVMSAFVLSITKELVSSGSCGS